MWITNIAKTTRATELKQALSDCGKVIGAKVVTNARFPGSCCYGYVTMETVADADRVIEKLNNTELNGQIIKIEKVRPDHMNPLKLARNLTATENKDKENKEKPKPSDSPKAAEKKKDEKGVVQEKIEKTERIEKVDMIVEKAKSEKVIKDAAVELKVFSFSNVWSYNFPIMHVKYLILGWFQLHRKYFCRDHEAMIEVVDALDDLDQDAEMTEVCHLKARKKGGTKRSSLLKRSRYVCSAIAFLSDA